MKETIVVNPKPDITVEINVGGDGEGTVKSVNGILPDKTGDVKLDIEGAVLDALVAFGTAPVVLDEDGAILTDHDGAVIINN